jgi:hypothetical protein
VSILRKYTPLIICAGLLAVISACGSQAGAIGGRGADPNNAVIGTCSGSAPGVTPCTKSRRVLIPAPNNALGSIRSCLARQGANTSAPLALANAGRGSAVLDGTGFFLTLTGDARQGTTIQRYGPNVMREGAITLFWTRSPTANVRAAVETCALGRTG